MTDAPQLDDETRAALFLFNAHLAAEAEAEKAARAVRRVEQQKDEAAARLRNLKQAGAPAPEVAAAESDYRAAVERLQAVREGREPEPMRHDEDDEGAEAASDAADRAEPEAGAEAASDAADGPEPEAAEPEAAEAAPDAADGAEPEAAGADEDPSAESDEPTEEE